MRPMLRLSLILLALFMIVAPAVTYAQSASTTAGSTTTTTTGPATSGGTSSSANSATSPATSTTTTTTSSVPWLWIVVGAIVVIGIIGVVAAGNRGDNTTRIVS